MRGIYIRNAQASMCHTNLAAKRTEENHLLNTKKKGLPKRHWEQKPFKEN